MDAWGFVALATLVIKIVTVVKSIGKDTNAVVTQVVVWGVGIVVLFLAGEADITRHMTIPGLSDLAIGDMDAASLILAGLILGSSGAFAYDVKKSIDNTDSSTEPALLSNSSNVTINN